LSCIATIEPLLGPEDAHHLEIAHISEKHIFPGIGRLELFWHCWYCLFDYLC